MGVEEVVMDSVVCGKEKKRSFPFYDLLCLSFLFFFFFLGGFGGIGGSPRGVEPPYMEVSEIISGLERGRKADVVA